MPRMVSVPGACEHVNLEGRCPTTPGEIAMLSVDALNDDLKVGDSFNPYGDPAPFTSSASTPPATDLPTTRSGAAAGGWSRRPACPLQLKTVPAFPGPWITTQAGIELRQPAVVRDGRPGPRRHARTSRPTTPRPPRPACKALSRRPTSTASCSAGLTLEAGNSLPEHATSCSTGAASPGPRSQPAVLSLILVALVLLSRLLAAAMGLRRGELALASLRGYGRRQLWFLGMLGAAGDPGRRHAARRRARLPRLAGARPGSGWCPGCRCRSCSPALSPSLGVVLVTALVAALVVRDAVNEPLSAQIAGVRRPTSAGRALVIVRLALVAAGRGRPRRGRQPQPSAGARRDRPGPADPAGGRGRVCSVGLLVLAVAELWVRWSSRRRRACRRTSRPGPYAVGARARW